MDDSHHGLVDEAPALELDGAVGVRGVGPRVLRHRPLLLRHLQMDQLVVLGRLAVHRTGNHVGRHQLTTGTSEETQDRTKLILLLLKFISGCERGSEQAVVFENRDAHT